MTEAQTRFNAAVIVGAVVLTYLILFVRHLIG